MPGKGGAQLTPVPAPSSPPQPSLRLCLPLCFIGPTPNPSPDSLPAPVLLGQHLHTLEAQLTQEWEKAVCVHRGPSWPRPMGLWPQEQARKQRPFSEPLPHFPQNTNYSLSRLGVSVYCKGFLLFGSFFGYFLIWGWGWGGLRMQGLLAPVLSCCLSGPPPPSCSICTTQSVPPSRKRAPPSQ